MKLCNKYGNGNNRSSVFKLKINFLFSPIPVSVTHCCCSISTRHLFGYILLTICRDIDCIWVWPFNFIYPCAAYLKSSLRNRTNTVSFCIYISERYLIVTWQHQVQLEREVPRSEKYARGRRLLNNISTWKASGFTGPVSACTGNYSSIDDLFIMQKTSTCATGLSSLGKDFPHSTFERFDKGLGYIPSLSIMSSVS